MKVKIILLLMFVSSVSYSQQNDTLYIDYDEVTELPFYKNVDGDTVIPVGVYINAITDKFIDFMVVVDSNAQAFAIDRNLDTMYQVYWYDNGPDYIEDGLFRMVENGKIGYANAKGEIVLRPMYACAGPFQNGFAQVAYECERYPEGEFTAEKSNEWFLIDHEGNETPIDQ